MTSTALYSPAKTAAQAQERPILEAAGSSVRQYRQLPLVTNVGTMLRYLSTTLARPAEVLQLSC